MWWYGAGWWWWWIAFVLIFLLLPLGYGWGYRGWGPWWRRGPRTRDRAAGEGTAASGRPTTRNGRNTEDVGWGWAGAFVWIVVIIAVVWVIAVWAGWGRGYEYAPGQARGAAANGPVAAAGQKHLR